MYTQQITTFEKKTIYFKNRNVTLRVNRLFAINCQRTLNIPTSYNKEQPEKRAHEHSCTKNGTLLVHANYIHEC